MHLEVECLVIFYEHFLVVSICSVLVMLPTKLKVLNLFILY